MLMIRIMIVMVVVMMIVVLVIMIIVIMNTPLVVTMVFRAPLPFNEWLERNQWLFSSFHQLMVNGEESFV